MMLSIKKWSIAFALLLTIGCAAHRLHSFPATDSRLKVMGRHLNDDGHVKFGASGVTFFMKFRGPQLKVKLEDEFRDSTNYNWFTVVTDSNDTHRFRTRPGQQIYTLVDSLSSGEHTLALSKATEGQNGHNQLDSIYTRQLLQADPLPKRKIEFIGNSITAGYGLDARHIPCHQGSWFDETHAWFAYGPRVARQFHAQWMNSAVSGIGMHRNFNSPRPVMPDVYGGVYMEYTNSITPWDFKKYTPDLVVIALGTNDFSAGDGQKPRSKLDGEAFVHDYSQFINWVRKKYPKAHFLLSNSPMLSPDQKKNLSRYLQRVVQKQKAAGNATITTFAFPDRYSSGCDGHPNFEQQANMARELLPKIRNFMHW